MTLPPLLPIRDINVEVETNFVNCLYIKSVNLKG